MNVANKNCAKTVVWRSMLSAYTKPKLPPLVSCLSASIYGRKEKFSSQFLIKGKWHLFIGVVFINLFSFD